MAFVRMWICVFGSAVPVTCLSAEALNNLMSASKFIIHDMILIYSRLE